MWIYIRPLNKSLQRHLLQIGTLVMTIIIIIVIHNTFVERAIVP